MKTGEILIEAARHMIADGDHLLAALLVAVLAANKAREEGDERGRDLALASALQALAAERGYEFNRHLVPVQPQDRGPGSIAAVFLTQNGEIFFAPPGSVIEKGYGAGQGSVIELTTPDVRHIDLAEKVADPSRVMAAIFDEIARQAQSGAAFAVVDMAKLLGTGQGVEV